MKKEQMNRRKKKKQMKRRNERQTSLSIILAQLIDEILPPKPPHSQSISPSTFPTSTVQTNHSPKPIGSSTKKRKRKEKEKGQKVEQVKRKDKKSKKNSLVILVWSIFL